MSAGNTGRYSAVVRESSPHVDSEPPESMAEQAGRSPGLTLSAGRFRVSLPLTLALAVVTALGGYFGSQARKENIADPGPLLTQLRSEVNLSLEKQAAEANKRADQLDHRLDTLETNLSLMRGSIDTLRDRLNDRAK